MNEKELIEYYMKTLDLTREEAKQLIEDDKNDFIGEEGERMTAKAKQVKRYEQSNEPRQKAVREKKVDEEKIRLIELFNYCLLHPDTVDDELPFKIDSVSVVNGQKEITFNVGENEYSISLIKHRPKKERK